MAKSLDKVLQPDGTYKWELVEPKPETVVITKEPVVEQTNDFESMTKRQLEDFGRTIGIELDRRHSKKVLIKELEEKLNPST